MARRHQSFQCPPPGVPCHHVACRYHLWTYQKIARGAVIAVLPTHAWGDADHTCVLQVASDGARTQDEVAAVMHVTKIHVQHLECSGLKTIRARVDAAGLGGGHPTPPPLGSSGVKTRLAGSAARGFSRIGEGGKGER